MAPTLLVVEPVHEEWAQGVTPNTDNLSVHWCPISIAEEPTIFLTRAEREALVQREKGKSLFNSRLSQP